MKAINAIMMSPPTPPITPPIIAPTGTDFEFAVALALLDEVADEDGIAKSGFGLGVPLKKLCE